MSRLIDGFATSNILSNIYVVSPNVPLVLELNNFYSENISMTDNK